VKPLSRLSCLFVKFISLGLALASLGVRADRFELRPSVPACAPVAARLGQPPVTATVAEENEKGPHLWLSALSPTRDFESIDQLRLLSWNMLNLYFKQGDWRANAPVGEFDRKAPVAKDPRFLDEMAKLFLDANPDFAVLIEIEGEGSLKDFARTYLKDAYRPLLIHGNDERIDIGFLIKKDLPFDLEVQSHRNVRDPSSGREAPIFSRDLPLISVRRAGAPRESKPLFALAGVHFKSQRDSVDDPRSVKVRAAQVQKALELVDEFHQHWGNDVPVLFSGDFNSDAGKAPEFAGFRQRGFADAFDLGRTPVPTAQRITHTYHPRGAPVVQSQLDAIKVSAGAQSIVQESRILRYRDEQGKVRPVPETRQQRDQQPSDHFPIAADLDFRALRKLTRQ
jgi:hypothetical protein